MFATNSILQETEIFSAKLLQHQEIAKSSPDNLPNFTNTLLSNIEEVYDTFNFKEATSKTDRMDFLEATRK